MSRPRSRPRRPHRPAFVLVLTLVVVFAVASLVLALTRIARVESLASTNELATAQASLVERGAEQYVLSVLTNDVSTLSTDMTDADWQQVQVGDGFFWVIRPDYQEDDLPQFGLVDESTKLDLNSATVDQMMKLPNMTEDVADSIVDWRDADDETTGQGAESSQYASQGYNAKNANFEAPEEMLLVQGVTRELYYGTAANDVAGAAKSTALTTNDPIVTNGWQAYFSPWSLTPPATTTGGGGGGGGAGGGGSTSTDPVRGKINVNQAPREVLLALPTVTEDDVDTLLSARADAVADDPTSTDWVQTALPNASQDLTNAIVGQGKQFSADIVAVSGNGRAFKRVRVVVDTLQSPPRIVYRRDVTDQGFPLDRTILDALRTGNASGGAGAAGGGMSR